jgi:hypothetical protein
MATFIFIVGVFVVYLLVGYSAGVLYFDILDHRKAIKRWFKCYKSVIYQLLEFIISLTVLIAITLYLANVMVASICANTSNCAVAISPNALVNPPQPVHIYWLFLFSLVAVVVFLYLIVKAIFFYNPKSKRGSRQIKA